MTKSLLPYTLSQTNTITLKTFKMFFRSYDIQEKDLSVHARKLIENAFHTIKQHAIDCHVHIIAEHNRANATYIHPNFFTIKHPICYFLRSVFLNAFGAISSHNLGETVQNTLDTCIQSLHSRIKCYILAFDKYHDIHGDAHLDKTMFYVSNQYVYDTCKKIHNCSPIISIHPYKHNALNELHYWADQGAQLIKWLPNVMNIDPSHKKCLAFYHAMKERNFTLLTHTGHESVIPFAENQYLGNPLLLRPALDSGVKVIMAHCATLGTGFDLDRPGSKRVPNFQLFLRLAAEEKYKNLLYGDISAITQINRMKYLASLIEHAQPGQILENRLINGSDYPIPGITFSTSTTLLWMLGYITREDKNALNQIYTFNPLLYDFVLKRTLRTPKGQMQFPYSIFMAKPELGIE